MDELKNNLPIYALEGAAFSGKTTLINYLKKYYANKVIVIPEVGEYVGGDKNFPSVPFQTIKDAKASTYFFLELEKKRCKDALSAYRERKLPVLMDRSTPVSSLIFYTLLAHKKVMDMEFVNEFLLHAVQLFSKETVLGNIFIPSSAIYLRPESKEVFLSRLSRGTKNGVFESWSSFEFLDTQYKLLLQHNYAGSNMVLTSKNTTVNLEQNSKSILTFFDKNIIPKPTNIFLNFMVDLKGDNHERLNDMEEKEFEFYINRAKLLVDKTNLSI